MRILLGKVRALISHYLITNHSDAVKKEGLKLVRGSVPGHPHTNICTFKLVARVNRNPPVSPVHSIL